MFTDITGFSAMMQSDEAFAMSIRNRHREIFKQSHEHFGGEILQYYGDGTLSIFDSTVAAVECAVDMQLAFQGHPQVPLRIGIHAGDISYDEEGAYGDGLNIAARVERLCTTGSIFVTAKVFDDIKNHPWLRAVSMGVFQLRNIFNDVEIYAISSKGLVVPDNQALADYPEFELNEEKVAVEKGPIGHRNKHVAWILALVLGVFGVHRLYLGKRLQGIMHFAGAIIAILITIESRGQMPLIAFFGVLAFIEAVLLFVMPKAEFDHRYNMGITRMSRKERRRMKKTQKREAKQLKAEKSRARKKQKVQEESSFKKLKEALRHYDRGDYQNAIRSLDKLLEANRDDLVVHYYLACCFSITRDREDAYYHLSEAVQCGFDDFDRIDTDPALAFLRSQPDYVSYKDNNFVRVNELPPAQPDLLETDTLTLTPYEQIERLGDRMERGEITRVQFEEEKKRILGND
ncbi:MAG: NINE protein [Saprospiraceae bacterium]|nr:NINE protein [Saprospiraceae bacterium]